MHLDLYLEELSRVFFKKDNLRNRVPWWLSTFYSFCIQGLVRKVLIELSKVGCLPSEVNQFLYLPLRLFIATSGSYDPLVMDTVQDLEGSPDAEDYQVAFKAVKQGDWMSTEILGAGYYLKRLFDDDAEFTIDASFAETDQPKFSDNNHDDWLAAGQITPSSMYQRTSSISSMGSIGPSLSHTSDVWNQRDDDCLYSYESRMNSAGSIPSEPKQEEGKFIHISKL